MKKPSLGEKELELLRFVTDHAPIAMGDVAEQYGSQRGLARTTMHTVLERLRRKGYLTREKIGGVYQYSPCVERTELLTNLVSDFMQRVLRGSLTPFTAYLAQHPDLREEELDELKELVRSLDERRESEGNDAD